MANKGGMAGIVTGWLHAMERGHSAERRKCQLGETIHFYLEPEFKFWIHSHQSVCQRKH